MVSEYAGEEWTASANGVTGCIFQSSSIFGPVLLGLSVDVSGSFTIVWWLLAVAPVVGIVLLKFLKPS